MNSSLDGFGEVSICSKLVSSSLIIFVFVLSPLARGASEIRITPDDIVRMVLQNNVNVELAALDFRISKAETYAANVDFDPLITLSPSYKLESSNPNLVYDKFLVTEKTAALSIGVKKKYGLGTSVEFALQELRIASDSVLAVLPDRFQSAGQIKVTQPFLNGGGADANMSVLNKSLYKNKRYYAQLSETIDDNVSKAMELFWDLYRAQSEVQIKNRALRDAQEQLSEINASQKVGKKSPVDLLAAQSKFELAKAAHLLAMSNLEETQEKLAKETLPIDKKSYLSNYSIVSVVDENVMNQKVQGFINTMTESPVELDNTSKLQRMAFEIDEARVDLGKSSNGLLPQLNLELTGISTGMGSTFSDAYSGMIKVLNPGYTITLNFSIPFGENSANGAYQRAAADVSTKLAQRGHEIKKTQKNYNFNLRSLKKNFDSFASLKSRVTLNKQIVRAKRQLYLGGRIRQREFDKAVIEFDESASAESQMVADLHKDILKIESQLGLLGAQEKKAYFSKMAAQK